MSAVPQTGRAESNLSARTTQQLYERYGRQIHAYCLHQLRSREEAEDAVQTTFLNAFRGLQRGTVPHAEQAWLYKIAQNVCSERRSSSARRLRLETPNSFDDLQETVPAQPRDSAVELIGLEDALESMPENQRRAILLREWQGLSYREISQELELSQAAVEMLIFRARRTLAGALEQPTEAKTLKRKVGRSLNLGSAIAAIKSLLTGGAAVKAVALAVAAGAVSVTAHAVQHTIVRHHPSHPHAKPASVPHRTAAGALAPVASGQQTRSAPSHATTGTAKVFVTRGGVAHLAVDESPGVAVAPLPAAFDQSTPAPAQPPTPAATPTPAPSETPKPVSSSDSPPAAAPAPAATPSPSTDKRGSDGGNTSSKPSTQSAPAPAAGPAAPSDKKGNDGNGASSKPSTQPTPAPAATPAASSDKKGHDGNSASSKPSTQSTPASAAAPAAPSDKPGIGKGKNDPVPGLGTFTATPPTPTVTTTTTATTPTTTTSTSTTTTPTATTPVDTSKGKDKKQQNVAAAPTVTTTPTPTAPTTTTTVALPPPPPAPADQGNGKDKKADNGNPKRDAPVVVAPPVTTPVPTTSAPAPSAGANGNGKDKGKGNGK